MKKIIIVSLLVFISTASSFMIPTVYAQGSSSNNRLVFEGVGAWRDRDRGTGQYRSHRNILWSECRNKCINTSNCTGVEYSLRSDGNTTCEIHTGRFHRVVNVAPEIGVGTVWLKREGARRQVCEPTMVPNDATCEDFYAERRNWNIDKIQMCGLTQVSRYKEALNINSESEWSRFLHPCR
jgi:hypothetical protein